MLMTRTTVWLLIGIVGVLLAIADLLARYVFGLDSPLGLHFHLVTILNGVESHHDLVVPAFFGILVAILGFGALLRGRIRYSR